MKQTIPPWTHILNTPALTQVQNEAMTGDPMRKNVRQVKRVERRPTDPKCNMLLGIEIGRPDFHRTQEC